jgi:AraC-like DNA-binding protein
MHGDVKEAPVTLGELAPRVLTSSIFTQGMTFPAGQRFNGRYVYDYELEYFTDSAGAMILEERLYPLRKGDIAFRQPGQFTQGILPYNCYLVSFDLVGNTAKDPETYNFCTETQFQVHYRHPLLEAIPPVFHPPDGEGYAKLFDGIFREFVNQNQYSLLLLRSLVLQVLYQLARDAQDPLAGSGLRWPAHRDTLKKAIDYLQQNYARKIGLRELADHAGMSPSYFHRLFSELMGSTPNEYLIRLRLGKAKELLLQTHLAVYEIALQCGFENIPYFSFLFKKQVGVSPGQFRGSYSYLRSGSPREKRGGIDSPLGI